MITRKQPKSGHSKQTGVLRRGMSLCIKSSTTLFSFFFLLFFFFVFSSFFLFLFFLFPSAKLGTHPHGSSLTIDNGRTTATERLCRIRAKYTIWNRDRVLSNANKLWFWGVKFSIVSMGKENKATLGLRLTGVEKAGTGRQPGR